MNWNSIAYRAGVRFVSPAKNAQDTIKIIGGARLVLAESMHGAIIADAFRVPWLPLSISPAFNEHKWRDWSESLLLDIEFQHFLVGLKKSRTIAAQFKSAILGRKTIDERPQERRLLPYGTHVAPPFSEKAKESARKWASAFSPAIEAMLVRDLVRVQRERPFLSSDVILRKRQSQISARIEQVRNRLQTSY